MCGDKKFLVTASSRQLSVRQRVIPPAKRVVREVIRPVRSARQMRRWERDGRPVPAPLVVKQREILWYGKAASMRTLVETGTHTGDTVAATRRRFDRVYSIELDDAYYEAARRRFAHSPSVYLLHGDSGSLLPEVLRRLDEPSLFWLDAHYSGGDTAKGPTDTPIEEELGLILGHHIDGHVILIDDARHFVGENDYPTVEEVRALFRRERPDWVFEVRDDIIRAHPSLP